MVEWPISERVGLCAFFNCMLKAAGIQFVEQLSARSVAISFGLIRSFPPLYYCPLSLRYVSSI